MAIYKNTDAIGEREDLSDVITRITPDETPLFSNMEKVATKGINHEWQVQELASAVDNNANNEGADYSYSNPQPTVRLGNQHQIFVQAGSVRNTLDTIDKAGRDKETAYVKVLKGIEQRRDIEKTLCASVAKSASDPRKFGTIETWLSNVSSAGDATDITAFDGSATRTDGTGRSMSLDQIETVMQACYEDGGNPSMLVVSPSKKATFSALSSGSVATNQIQMTASAPQDAVIIGSVSIFLTDFGTLNVVIDRQMQNDRVYLLDPEYIKMGALSGRSFSVSDVAPTGDATKFAIVSEMTLIVNAPKAHGAVYDLS